MSEASLSNWKFITGGVGGALMPDQPSSSSGRPKLKFNFTAKFEFRAGGPFGAEELESLDVQLKEATRPSITVVFSDINQYNFRTTVKTKVDYGTVSLAYYDDPDNKAHGVLTNYLKKISPIANQSSLDGPPDPFGSYSSLGPLTESEKMSPISKIIVTHFYAKNGGQSRVRYEYLNPKFEKLDFGGLNMSESDIALVTMSLKYDSVNIVEE